MGSHTICLLRLAFPGIMYWQSLSPLPRRRVQKKKSRFFCAANATFIRKTSPITRTHPLLTPRRLTVRAYQVLGTYTHVCSEVLKNSMVFLFPSWGKFPPVLRKAPPRLSYQRRRLQLSGPRLVYPEEVQPALDPSLARRPGSCNFFPGES